MLIPVLFWLLLHGVVLYLTLLFNYGSNSPMMKQSTIQLICIFSNLFLIRYYLLRLKFDYTGRGILLATFIMAIAYFYIHL